MLFSKIKKQVWGYFKNKEKNRELFPLINHKIFYFHLELDFKTCLIKQYFYITFIFKTAFWKSKQFYFIIVFKIIFLKFTLRKILFNYTELKTEFQSTFKLNLRWLFFASLIQIILFIHFSYIIYLIFMCHA